MDLSSVTNLIIWAAAFAATLYGTVLAVIILSHPSGNEKMKEIALAIQQGAAAYLTRQYIIVGPVALAIAFLIYPTLGLNSAVGFLVGAFASALAGFIGMSIAVRANIRCAQAATDGLSKAFDIAYKGGAVTGFLVVGLALAAVYGFWQYTYDLPALISLVSQ